MKTVLCAGAMTKKDAHDECPWAKIIVKVSEGWRCFDNIHSYKDWQAKKKEEKNHE